MRDASNAAGEFGSPYLDIPPEANSVEAIVRHLIQVLVHSDELPAECADEIVHQILRRESLGSTAVGNGTAVPHAQSDKVNAPCLIAGRCSSPVNWLGAPDGIPVSAVCLAVSPRSPEAHRKTLEMAAEKLRQIKPS
jgi:mannitol/fructose-specific phosphotransferase system IIA component (Ntr-type)